MGRERFASDRGATLTPTLMTGHEYGAPQGVLSQAFSDNIERWLRRPLRRLRNRLTARIRPVLTTLEQVVKPSKGRYRPEKNYMRGPRTNESER